MLTKAKTKRSKASKPAQTTTAGRPETDGKRPPAVFTPAQLRRMRALFARRRERPLTAAEQEELFRLVDALYDDAIERGTRKLLAAHPELADEHGNLNIPLVDALLREKYAAETRSHDAPEKERKRR